VALESSNENAARVPSTVTIPAGALSASFPVAAVNNDVLDGKKTAFIRASATATSSGERLGTVAAGRLDVLDDDGPTLRLELNRGLVGEGLNPAATGTVTRNSANNTAVVVTLISSATTEATVPATVTILANQPSVTFPIASVNDGVTDGDKTVTITAAAAGFRGGSATLIVTDRSLPDLGIAKITVPATGLTESSFEVSYRIENSGFVATSGAFIQRVFLSNDAAIGDDTLLTQTEFSGSIPPGGHFDQTFSLRLPRVTGDYWIVVTTDSQDTIAEALESNNSALSPTPIHVEKAYGATVETEISVAPAGSPVPLRGQATLTADGKPAPFSPVTIHLTTRDTKRTIAALTDANGRFTATFQPLPGEAGRYEIGADHPGVSEAKVQDTFTLLGIRTTPRDSVLRVSEGATLSSSIRIENLSDLPLNQLAATVTEKPANLQVTLALKDTTLLGSGETSLELTATATDTSITQSGVIIRLSNPDGVTADVRLPVVIELLRPRLVADPSSLLAGMKRGAQSSVQFKLTNTGGAPSGDLKILPPAIPWLTVASGGQIPSLAPGAETTVTLVLTPPADLPLGEHQGSIVISGDATSVTVPFNFRSLSEAVGDLKISAVDEYTYYAEGSPPVTGASVTVTDELTGKVVASGLTDARGELIIRNLTEAYYRIEARADGHADHRSTILVAAGKTNDLLAFLNRETVKYIFTVVPTEIEDRTKIVIETVFETVVPIPVITVEPMLIDLADFKEAITQIDLKITNHGLVAADNVRVEFPEHPDVSVKPLVDKLGKLPARSSITVPLVIRRLNLSAAFPEVSKATVRAHQTSSSGGCDLRGDTLYDLLCGPTTRTYATPIQVRNAGRGCGGSGGGNIVISGGFSGYRLGGGGGSGSDRGGGAVYVGPSEVRAPSGPCSPCFRRVLFNVADCAGTLFLPNVEGCYKSAIQCFIGFKWPGDDLDRIDTASDCFGVIYNCLTKLAQEAATKSLKTPLNVFSCLLNTVDIANTCFGGAAASSESPTAGLASMRQSKQSLESSITRPELEPLKKHLGRLQTLINIESNLFGSTVWLEADPGVKANWLDAFVSRTSKDSEAGRRLSPTEQSQLRALGLPAPVTATDANTFIERWNRTMDYWQARRFNSTDVPSGQSRDFLAFDTFHANLDAVANAIAANAAEGFGTISEAVENARQDLVRFYEEDSGGGDCATVRLRIEQQAVITRDAFDATLEVANSTGSPLEEVSVELSMRNENGEETTSLFGIRSPTLSGLSGVDGTGVIAANSTGKASWILIPTSDAAPQGPTVMLVGGTLKYRQDGTLISIPLAPASITVLPNASLKVKYFNQRDVFSDDPFTDEIEPAIPFSLGVLIQNVGKGAARNVRITSAQPEIIENEKGLLIDFEIIATEVAGQNLAPSLTANFGNIGPDEVAQGRWLLRSSLQGLFIDYKASFEHLDGLGDKRLSLIESVEIHELNHVVRADGSFEDGKLDFLANDVPDLRDLPDTLHLSNGRIEPVSLLEQANVDAAPSTGDLEVKLTAALPAGWAYLRIPDPADGQFPLNRVLRADGTELPLDLNVWTTDRTFVGNGRRPVREHILHLLDHNSGGSYTLAYGEPQAVDRTAPISKVEPLAASSFASIPVRWSGDDDAGGSGIEFFDIFVSVNSGPFNPWLRKTTLTGALYDGVQNERYAFYSVATDKAGNAEPAHTTPDAQTVVALANTAPKLTVPGTLRLSEGETLTVTIEATDSDVPANALTFSLDPGAPSGAVLDPTRGVLTWVTGEGNGPSTNKIIARVTDNGAPSLNATAELTVIVNEVNRAPEIVALADRIINEGTRLTFSASGSDSDLPSNALTFRLAAGAPVGATITPAGVFTWTPTALQGPSTNRIEVVATDNGSPNLNATTAFTVVVRDALGDFILEVGKTNVLAGKQGVVPIQLSSGVDLTRLSFVLDAPATRLRNLTLKPLVPEIALASLHALTPDQFKIEITSGAGQVLQGNQAVAQLSFDADDSGESARVDLQISQIEGDRSNGTRLTKATTQSGRVIVVGKQPVLEATRLPSPALVLYGRPGASFAIEFSTELKPAGSWTVLTRVPQTETFQIIGNLRSDSSAVFYRAAEFVAAPARVEVLRAGDRTSLLLYGQSGRRYEVQSLTDLFDQNGWISHRTISLTNSFQLFEPPDSSGPSSFYRVRER